MFNKALLLIMKDGKQIVAKIPNSNAESSHFTIASEIATMNFVGEHLTGFPRESSFSHTSAINNT